MYVATFIVTSTCGNRRAAPRILLLVEIIGAEIKEKAWSLLLLLLLLSPHGPQAVPRRKGVGGALCRKEYQSPGEWGLYGTVALTE